MKLEITPQARKYIGEKGGCVTVWTEDRLTGG